MAKPKQIIVVGAGFSGLSIAYWAVKNGISVELIEKAERLGGLLSTERIEGGHLVESAANGFLFQPEFAELEKDLNVTFIPTQKQSRKRFIYRNSALPFVGPYRLWPLSVFETIGMIFNVIKNLIKKTSAPRDRETISTWGSRVVGVKATHYLLETALQGIYAGVASKMSASLIMGRFFKKDQNLHRREPVSLRPRKGTHSHPEGMGALVNDLKIFLEKQKNFSIKTSETFDLHQLAIVQRKKIHLVLSVPPDEAYEILKISYPSVAQKLSKIEQRPLTTTTLIFDKIEGEKRMPRGFGVLFPRSEGFEVLGILRNHHIFKNRSDQVSETWIYSGDVSLETLLTERAKLTGFRLDPIYYRRKYWPRAIPHYTVDLEEILASDEMKTLEKNNIYLFGNYTGQVGLAKIFLNAKERILQL